jgi:hypothetical protein
MSRKLSDLCPSFRPAAMALIAHGVEAGIAVMIVDTLRTTAEQEEALMSGRSETRRSFHLAQKKCPTCGELVSSDGTRGLSHAIDVAPYQTYMLHGPDKLQWDAADPAWQALGKIGEGQGLVWGGRWTKLVDVGHFQRRGDWLG